MEKNQRPLKLIGITVSSEFIAGIISVSPFIGSWRLQTVSFRDGQLLLSATGAVIQQILTR